MIRTSPESSTLYVVKTVVHHREHRDTQMIHTNIPHFVLTMPSVPSAVRGQLTTETPGQHYTSVHTLCLLSSAFYSPAFSVMKLIIHPHSEWITSAALATSRLTNGLQVEQLSHLVAARQAVGDRPQAHHGWKVTPAPV